MNMSSPRPVIIPRNGGRCRNWWKDTAVAMVANPRKMILLAPGFIFTCPGLPSGIPFETNGNMIAAGIIQLTREGRKR